MTATPHVMLAATYLTFAKDKRGGLEEHPRPPPLPLYMKKPKCLEMIFRTLGTKKIKKSIELALINKNAF